VGISGNLDELSGKAAPGPVPASPVQPPGPYQNPILVGVLVDVRRKSRPVRCGPYCTGRGTGQSGITIGPLPVGHSSGVFGSRPA
jgi:hypothetical protein